MGAFWASRGRARSRAAVGRDLIRVGPPGQSFRNLNPEPYLEATKTKALGFPQGPFHKLIPGDDLLSHTLAHAVPSALRGLTAVFGMGTGVSPSPQSPENLNWKEQAVYSYLADWQTESG